MNNMIGVRPLPGEYFAGHLARFNRINYIAHNKRSSARAMPLRSNGQKVQFLRPDLHQVAEAAQLDHESYWRTHSLDPLSELLHLQRSENCFKWVPYINGKLPLGFGQRLPYERHCQTCVKTQRREYGFAYWRRDQQVLGINSCSLHGTPLRLSRRAFDRSPALIAEKSIEISVDLVAADRSEILTRYREITNGILNSNATYCGEAFDNALKRKCAALGYDTEDGAEDLFHNLQNQIPKAWIDEHFRGLGTGTMTARNHIRRVLIGKHSPGHFCTLVMAAIFSTAEEALAAVTPTLEHAPHQ